MLDKVENSCTPLMEHFQHAPIFGPRSNMWQLEIRPTASSVFSFQNFFSALNYHPSLVCSQRSYIN